MITQSYFAPQIIHEKWPIRETRHLHMYLIDVIFLENSLIILFPSFFFINTKSVIMNAINTCTTIMLLYAKDLYPIPQ